MIPAALGIGIIWLIFLAYWATSSFSVKKNIGKTPWSRRAWVRIAILVGVIITLDILNATQSSVNFKAWLTSSATGAAAGIAGLILAAAGVGLAIWARVHLGRNWSAFPTLKEGHELVTSGPYRAIRHPIYTGIIIALLGTVSVAGPIWILVLIGVGITFVLRVKTEERLMLQRFPDQYPEYMARTKALIPFVW